MAAVHLTRVVRDGWPDGCTNPAVTPWSAASLLRVILPRGDRLILPRGVRLDALIETLLSFALPLRRGEGVLSRMMHTDLGFLCTTVDHSVAAIYMHQILGMKGKVFYILMKR